MSARDDETDYLRKGYPSDDRDETVPAMDMPQSEAKAAVQETVKRLKSHMDHCYAERIRYEKMAAFYGKEAMIIKAFLAEDYFSSAKSAPVAKEAW